MRNRPGITSRYRSKARGGWDGVIRADPLWLSSLEESYAIEGKSFVDRMLDKASNILVGFEQQLTTYANRLAYSLQRPQLSGNHGPSPQIRPKMLLEGRRDVIALNSTLPVPTAYATASNNPANFTDPSGFLARDLCKNALQNLDKALEYARGRFQDNINALLGGGEIDAGHAKAFFC